MAQLLLPKSCKPIFSQETNVKMGSVLPFKISARNNIDEGYSEKFCIKIKFERNELSFKEVEFV